VAGVLFSGQHAGEARPDAKLNLGLSRPLTVEERASQAAQAFDTALGLRPNRHSACALLQSKCATLGWLLQNVPPANVPRGLPAQQRDCILLLSQQCGGLAPD